MAARFQILPDSGIVHVRYSGRATVEDGFRTFRAYKMHPLARPGQKHFVDLSAVTEVDDDYDALFHLKRREARDLIAEARQVLMVHLAPTQISLRMAHNVLRCWGSIPGAVIRTAEDWDGAMDILGVARTALDQIVHRTD